MKPIIGITVNSVNGLETINGNHFSASHQNWSLLSNYYSEAVIRAGGIPVLIPITEDEAYNADIVEAIDGLILSGGADLDPMLSNQRSDEFTGQISPDRDNQEMMILDRIYRKFDKPILGICRGAQLMNVYLGGKLIMDIPSAGYPSHAITNIHGKYPSHYVDIVEHTLLHDIIQDVSHPVNSLHHQGLSWAELAPDLKAVATSDDGLIEAFQCRKYPERFILGVQWHPEIRVEESEPDQEIFNQFIQAAATK